MNGDSWNLHHTVPLEMTDCKSGPRGQRTHHHRRPREKLDFDVGSWEISTSTDVQCSLM